MPTTHAPETKDEAVPYASEGACDFCEERRARWAAADPATTFEVCHRCRSIEPCGRCGVQKDCCACPEGPDLLAWVAIPDAR